MIASLNPAALAGLAAIAAPIVIHLLRQHRASRVLFPSLRFIHPSRTAAIRLRRLADPWLLLLRVAAVGFAACALAQPVWLTESRLSGWNARVARAIVVDTSDSMSLYGARTAAREAADAESRAAVTARRFEAVDLREGLRQGATWLSTAPPARREIVIVSDFQPGTLTPGDLVDIPQHIGLRGVQVGTAPETARFTGMALLSPPTDGGSPATRVHDIRLDRAATGVTITAGPATQTGMRLVTTPGQEGAARSLMRVVAAAGTPAGGDTSRIAIVFSGAPAVSPVRPIGADWMRAAVLRVMEDRDLRQAAEAARAADGPGPGPAEPWTDVVRDARQRTIVRAAASGSELIFDVSDQPDGFLAAALVRAASGSTLTSYAEHEIVRLSPDDVAAFTRPAAPVGPEAAAYLDRTDAPWVWGLVLLVLGVEMLVRRPNPVAAQETRADAA